jgi:Flp pilus assembly protein TadG
MKTAALSIAKRLRFLRSESGNALFELALGIGVLATVVIGSVEFGRIAYASIEVNDAARAGASYGAESRTYAADNANVTNAAKKDAPDVTNMTATATYWCKCADGSASTCGATDCTSSRILEYVTVNTTAGVKALFYVPGLPRSYTVTGNAVMRVEQ